MKNCTVGIVDDSVYEPDEVFYLRLADPQGSDGITARVGSLDKTAITITNKEDGEPISLLLFLQEFQSLLSEVHMDLSIHGAIDKQTFIPLSLLEVLYYICLLYFIVGF